MASYVDSSPDPMAVRTIDHCHVMSTQVSVHDAPLDADKNSFGRENLHNNLNVIQSPFHLPEISEDTRSSGNDSNMPNRVRFKNERLGRRYTLSKNQSLDEAEMSPRPKSRSRPGLLPRSASMDSSSGFQSPSSNGNLSTGLSPSKVKPPRSPRHPRRLPSLGRAESQESPGTSPRDTDAPDEVNGIGSPEEPVEPELTDNHVRNAWGQQKQLPSSSFAFQQVLTDLHDRPNSSMGIKSPGDLMVRRSSLVSSGLMAIPLIEVEEESNSVDDTCDISMDIELESPKENNNNIKAEETLETEKGTHKLYKGDSINSTDHSKNGMHHRKKSIVTKTSQSDSQKDNGHADSHKQTSPRRHIKFPVDKNLLTCPLGDRDLSPSPDLLVSSPRAEMLEEAATGIHRAQKSMKKWRSRNATLSVSGTSETSSSPERSPRPRRKISDASANHRDVSPARSQHNYPTKINMKTVGQITKFITAAAASLTAPGLNRNQQLLPSDVSHHLPVLDPTGRLLHRRRDQSMRLAKQAVDLEVEGEEKSDVFSWDELRDCRYLRNRNKSGKESRRNSLLGFNEV